MLSKGCRPSNGSSLNSELLHSTILINISFVSHRTGSVCLPFALMSYAWRWAMRKPEQKVCSTWALLGCLARVEVMLHCVTPVISCLFQQSLQGLSCFFLVSSWLLCPSPLNQVQILVILPSKQLLWHLWVVFLNWLEDKSTHMLYDSFSLPW